jgi:CRP/FNR family transcriptional regulator, cyclic AMP receptor protein
VNENRIDLATILRATALLDGLSDAEVKTLAVRAARKPFRTGELLFAEGEPCHGLHIIIRGKIRIFKTSANGREQVLAINVPGESVAELPVFDGGPYPASAVATEDTLIAFIAQRDFQAYCLEHPQVALKILAAAGGRLRRLVAIIEELSFTTIRQRLVAALIRMAEADGFAADDGIHLQLALTHQELANELGTVRELISRNLARLNAEGILDVDGRQIVVRDMKRLRTVVETP